jgi:hypothetical protein
MYTWGQPHLTIPKRDGFGFRPVSEEFKEKEKVKVEERAVLRKFEGDPLPENEFERVHIVDGVIVAIEKIENGEVVSTETVKEE